MTDQEMIRHCLDLTGQRLLGGRHRTSSYALALGEARQNAGRNKQTGILAGLSVSLWSGTMVYMSLLDLIGDTFQRTDRPAAKSRYSVTRSLELFSPRSLHENEIYALYALRCSFMHEFALGNVNLSDPKLTHYFFVDRVGPLVQFPSMPWNGDWANVPDQCRTTVNLVEVGDVVEEVHKELIDCNEHGTLSLRIARAEFLGRYQREVPAPETIQVSQMGQSLKSN